MFQTRFPSFKFWLYILGTFLHGHIAKYVAANETRHFPLHPNEKTKSTQTNKPAPFL